MNLLLNHSKISFRFLMCIYVMDFKIRCLSQSYLKVFRLKLSLNNNWEFQLQLNCQATFHSVKYILAKKQDWMIRSECLISCLINDKLYNLYNLYLTLFSGLIQLYFCTVAECDKNFVTKCTWKAFILLPVYVNILSS